MQELFFAICLKRERVTRFDVRSISRDKLQTIDRYAERRFHRHITIRSQSRSCDWSAIGQKSGALTIAIVNDVTSPVALACELTLPVGAGPERAVAATKFCCTVDGHKWATN